MSDTKDDDLADLIDVLHADMERALNALLAVPEQYERRTFSRAFFAAVEATTFLMKQQCLKRVEAGAKLYTFEEIALLREETYSLDQRGQITTQSKFLPTELNFRFALELFMRETVKDFRLKVDDAGWGFFKQAAQIRNRITHPKSVKLANLTHDETRTVVRAYAWFAQTIVVCMTESAEIHEAQAVAIRSKLKDWVAQSESLRASVKTEGE
jgi:hypothetical protein